MANEISIASTLRISNGFLSQVWTHSTTADQTAAFCSSGVQAIGTAAELLAVSSDVGTAGWGYVKNLHTANYVDFGTDTSSFSPLIRLYPGQGHPVSWATTNIAARAQTSGSTAVCNIIYSISNK